MGICVRTRVFWLIGISLLLTACGGGDGPAVPAASSPNPPPTAGQQPPPPPVDGEAPDGGTPPAGGSDNPPSVKNSPPSINGSPPLAVLYDDRYVFEPEAQDADGDILLFSIANSPPWAQFEPTTGKLEGTPGAGDIGTYEDIVITVTDGADDAALEAFAITVGAVGNGSVELSWLAPTENDDGSPLTDLAGYKLYWGTAPGEYTDSVIIENPSVVTYLVDNLVPNTYYFVATAVNAAGEESDYSAEAVGNVS
jgi:hypothetical protein